MPNEATDAIIGVDHAGAATTGRSDADQVARRLATQAARDAEFAAALDRLSPRERAAIAKRRKRYDLGPQAPSGLALSGGGIRSATFSLGLLRGLSERHLLQRFDYLSTVSGGGYAGSFLCGLFVPRGKQKAIVDPAGDADLLGQPRAQAALGYLRQSGRYLTPGGGRDYVYAVTMLTRNWLALALVAGIAIVLVELLLDAWRAWLFSIPGWRALLLHLDFRWGEIAMSPLALLVPPLVAIVVGLGWAYWLTMSDVTRPHFRPPLIGTALVLAFALFHAFGLSVDALFHGVLRPSAPADASNWGAALLALFAVIALAAWSLAGWVEHDPVERSVHRRAMLEDRIRHRLSGWQASVGLVLLAVTLLALADSASYLFSAEWPYRSVIFPTIMGAAVPGGQWLVKRLAVLPQAGRPGVGSTAKEGLIARFGPALAWAAGFLFALAALAFWGNLAHHLSWTRIELDETKDLPHLRPWFHWALLAAVLFVGLAAMTRGFVNLSSLASFYADRLCRAYLGAGNPQRLGLPRAEQHDGKRKDALAVQTSDAADDVDVETYYGKVDGAPIHLINVTVNETHGKGPATVQRDRHGLNMVLSPEGMSFSEEPRSRACVIGLPAMLVGAEAETKDAAARRDDFFDRIDKPGQSLPLSTWIGISGAAFTTGLGSQTNLAKSVLAFLANVRLGYWWKARPRGHRFVPSYVSLYREMTASFPGTAKPLWYLSDGGHFENTGVYELVRRRLPLIVVSDNGCDPEYGFEDVANLVRKCRIDFNAQITFLSEDDLDDRFDAEACPALRACFGGPSAFARPKDATMEQSHAFAMLGKIEYGPAHAEDTTPNSIGTLLVIKPRLTRDGPSDLLRYLYDNPQFPQQSTLDQSFDEAQWESYYELGRRIAMRLFDADLGGKPGEGADWSPARMEPLTWTN